MLSILWVITVDHRDRKIGEPFNHLKIHAFTEWEARGKALAYLAGDGDILYIRPAKQDERS